MKKKELKKMREKSVAVLTTEAETLRAKAASKKMEVLTGSEQNLHAASSMKRDVAQIMTIINEKLEEAKKEKREERGKS